MAPIRDGLRQQGKRGNVPGGSLLKGTPSGSPEGSHFVPMGCGWYRFGFKPAKIRRVQTAPHWRLPSFILCQLFDAVMAGPFSLFRLRPRKPRELATRTEISKWFCHDGLGHTGWLTILQFRVQRLLASWQLVACTGSDATDTCRFVFTHAVSDRTLADTARRGRTGCASDNRCP